MADNESNNALHFPDLESEHFDVFTHWTYHDDIPSRVFEPYSGDILDIVNALYELGRTLGAPVLQNKLVDTYCDLRQQHRQEGCVHWSVPSTALQHYPCLRNGFPEFLLHESVAVTMGRAGGSALVGEFDIEDARLYHSILTLVRQCVADEDAFVAKLDEAHLFHVHEEEEYTCYPQSMSGLSRRSGVSQNNTGSRYFVCFTCSCSAFGSSRYILGRTSEVQFGRHGCCWSPFHTQLQIFLS